MAISSGMVGSTLISVTGTIAATQVGIYIVIFFISKKGKELKINI
jgi:hypothetical protein